MVRLVGMLMLGLECWMLYDAYRRRAECHWLWIIVGIPGGSLLYFFMVRLQDRDAKILGTWLENGTVGSGAFSPKLSFVIKLHF